jgi:hypothetical protein
MRPNAGTIGSSPPSTSNVTSIFPARGADRPLVDDELAQPDGQGTTAGAVTGDPGGRNQNRRHY